MSGDRPLPKLPDDALTVFARGGIDALDERSDEGLLKPGDYECPECDGSGIRESGMPDECATCGGFGSVTFPLELRNYGDQLESP